MQLIQNSLQYLVCAGSIYQVHVIAPFKSSLITFLRSCCRSNISDDLLGEQLASCRV